MARYQVTVDTARRSSGVTLLELLVVLTIMLMVTAAAIPIVRPALQNRQMRESSRLLQSYVSAARTRAIETGRVCGLMFERSNQLPYSQSVVVAEVPPPYLGDPGSLIAMDITNAGVIYLMGSLTPGTPAPTPPTLGTADTSWQNQIRWGDLVQLNSGTTYILSSTTTLPDPKAGQVITKSTCDPNSMVPGAPKWHLTTLTGAVPSQAGFAPPFFYLGTTFKIIRQPIRVATSPMELPEGVVVDLINSGVGNGTIPLNATPPVIDWDPVVLFNTGGAMISTSFTSAQLTPIVQPLFLLLGKRELMPDVSVSGLDENLYEPNTAAPKNEYLKNFWISIGYQTGMATVAEMAANAGTPASSEISKARQFAKSGQSTGGR